MIHIIAKDNHQRELDERRLSINPQPRDKKALIIGAAVQELYERWGNINEVIIREV